MHEIKQHKSPVAIIPVATVLFSAVLPFALTNSSLLLNEQPLSTAESANRQKDHAQSK